MTQKAGTRLGEVEADKPRAQWKRKVDEQDIHYRYNTNFRMTQKAGTRLGEADKQPAQRREKEGR